MAYGQGDLLRENQQDLHMMDDMVTVAKHALRSIMEAVDKGGGLGSVGYTAAKALAEIEANGGK